MYVWIGILKGGAGMLQHPTKLDTAIQDVMNQKLRAIREQNESLYMATVIANDEHYRTEQGRWFKDISSSAVRDLSFEVESTDVKENGDVRAHIHQHHMTNEVYDFEYELVFKLEGGTYRDGGVDFDIVDTDRYTFKYIHGDDNARRLSEYCDEAIDSVERLFNKKIQEKVEFKCYNELDLVRQRTMPTFGFSFLAWAEPDESTKFFAGGDDLTFYKGIMKHELIHFATRHPNDVSVPTWLSEGLAFWYGNMHGTFPKKEGFFEQFYDLIDFERALTELEGIDLSKLEDHIEIVNYYALCGSYIGYMVDRFGHDRVMSLLDNWTENSIFEKLEITREEITRDYRIWVRDQLNR